MTPIQLIVSSAGLILIGFIYWFFFGKKLSVAEASYARGNAADGQGDIRIKVDGGYNPAAFKIKKGVETTLKITRSDSSSCLEEIVLPDFKIKQYLPLNEEIEIKINPDVAGEFPFHCGMNMYHGKIIVE